MNDCRGREEALGLGGPVRPRHEGYLGLILVLGALASIRCTPGAFHVTDRTPEPGSIDVAVGEPIQVHFEVPIAAGSLSEERVRLMTADGDEVARSLQLSEDRRVLTVVPEAPLPAGQGYQVTFEPGLTSEDGRELDVSSASWGWYVPTWLLIGDGPRGGGPVMSPSLSFDDQGAPVVAWSAMVTATTRRVFVQRWDGTTWQDMGQPGPDTDSRVVDLWNEVLLVRGPGGQLWLRWWEYNTRLARWNGTAWQQIWSSPAGEHVLRRFDIDPAGHPIGVFSPEIKRLSGDHWEELGSPPVSPGQGVPCGADVRVDAQGRLLLAQALWPSCKTPGGSMRLSRRDGSSWEVLGEQPASTLGGRIPYVILEGIAVDSTGKPLVVWQENASYCYSPRDCVFLRAIHFHRWKDGTWEEAAPRSKDPLKGLALEPSGVLVLSYVEVQPGINDLILQRSTGGEWVSLGPLRQTPYTYMPVLAMSPAGLPHVAYVDKTSEGDIIRVGRLNR